MSSQQKCHPWYIRYNPTTLYHVHHPSPLMTCQVMGNSHRRLRRLMKTQWRIITVMQQLLKDGSSDKGKTKNWQVGVMCSISSSCLSVQTVDNFCASSCGLSCCHRTACDIECITWNRLLRSFFVATLLVKYAVWTCQYLRYCAAFYVCLELSSICRFKTEKGVIYFAPVV